MKIWLLLKGLSISKKIATISGIIAAVLITLFLINNNQNISKVRFFDDEKKAGIEQTKKEKPALSRESTSKASIDDTVKKKKKGQPSPGKGQAQAIPQIELDKWTDIVKQVSKLKVSKVLIRQASRLISIRLVVEEKASDKVIYDDLVNHIRGLHNAYPNMSVTIVVSYPDGFEPGFAKYYCRSGILNVDAGKKRFEGKIETVP